MENNTLFFVESLFVVCTIGVSLECDYIGVYKISLYGMAQSTKCHGGFAALTLIKLQNLFQHVLYKISIQSRVTKSGSIGNENTSTNHQIDNVFIYQQVQNPGIQKEGNGNLTCFLWIKVGVKLHCSIFGTLEY